MRLHDEARCVRNELTLMGVQHGGGREMRSEGTARAGLFT